MKKMDMSEEILVDWETTDRYSSCHLLYLTLTEQYQCAGCQGITQNEGCSEGKISRKGCAEEDHSWEIFSGGQ